MGLPRGAGRERLLPVEWHGLQGPILLESCAGGMPFRFPLVCLRTRLPTLRRTSFSGYFGMSRCTTFTRYPALPKMLADFLGDHDGTVLAAGAAECDGQIALAFVNVMRQQVDEQIGDARDEFARLRERTNVFGQARIAPGQRPELGNEMRIGQKAHIEDQVGVLGNALPESETHAGHQNAFFRGLLLKTLGDVSAKFVNIELGSIDDEIGDRPNRAQVAAFRL